MARRRQPPRGIPINIDFTQDKWPLSAKAKRMAWAALDQHAEQRKARIVHRSKRIVCREDVISFECRIVPING